MAKASVAFTVKVGKKGKAKAHAQYILRQGKYSPQPNKDNDKYEDLILKGHGNLPEWAAGNPALFFDMSDIHERKNGSTYREEVIPLPREFNRQQQEDFIREWIEQEISDKHAYAFAIHEPLASDGKPNPHVHFMYSDRIDDGIERPPEQYFKRYNSKHPERGGAKKANSGLKSSERKELLLAKRERFGDMINKKLREIGHYDKDISMKSLKAQGIDREPINMSLKDYKVISKLENELQQAEEKRDLFNKITGFDLNRELMKSVKQDDKELQEQEQLQEETRRRLERSKQDSNTNIIDNAKNIIEEDDDISIAMQMLEKLAEEYINKDDSLQIAEQSAKEVELTPQTPQPTPGPKP